MFGTYERSVYAISSVPLNFVTDIVSLLRIYSHSELGDPNESQNTLNRIHYVYNVLLVLRCSTFFDLYCPALCYILLIFTATSHKYSITHDRNFFLGICCKSRILKNYGVFGSLYL